MSIRKRLGAPLALLDLLFLFLLGTICLLWLSVLLINPPEARKIINRSGDYFLHIKWEDGSSADVDLWLREPDGRVIFFNQREGRSSHLERDDLGLSNDIDANGNPILANEELLVIRTLDTGWYEASVHLYNLKGAPNPTVTWRLVASKSGEAVAQGSVTLSPSRVEIGLVQFEGVRKQLGKVYQDPARLIAHSFMHRGFQ